MKNKKDWNQKHFLISRTDSIGDVLLTLPITAWLKLKFPDCTITFLCKNYTAPIVSKYKAVDHVLILDELTSKSLSEQITTIQNGKYDVVIHVFPRKELAKLMKKAAIPIRIGTSHRLFHFLTCNIRPSFTRKNSPLHESQLNFELLRPFGLNEIPLLQTINHFTEQFEILKQVLPFDIDLTSTICLHPKSQGSAREWPMKKYLELAELLIDRGFTVCFTGTDKEGNEFRHLLPQHPKCIDSTGKLSIDQLIWLIHASKGLVACSTGPLHIAGYCGIRTVGLFAPRVPIHPGRWKPLGTNSTAIVFDEKCATCSAKKPCTCIEKIPAERVLETLLN